MSSPPSVPPRPAIDGLAPSRGAAGTVRRRDPGGEVSAGPRAHIRRALPRLMEASAEAFGGAVGALLSDMERVSQRVERLEWLAGTPALLAGERSYREALDQLRWWGDFLKELPSPRLLSERSEGALRRWEAQRLRARVLAREAALIEHRRLVGEQLSRRDLPAPDRARLQRVYEDPDETQWWVDPRAVIAEAEARLPPPPSSVPIRADDLSPVVNPSGFQAVAAMRAHPELGPRAAGMDRQLSAVLRSELRLPRAAAAEHARALTDIFWIALRRAMGVGDVQLTTSLHLMVASEEAPVQQQFTGELLPSWLHYLEGLPPPRPTLGQRLGRLLGRRPEGADPGRTPAGGGPRQLVDAGPPRALLED